MENLEQQTVTYDFCRKHGAISGLRGPRQRLPVTVDLPVFKEEEVEIEVSDDSLTIHAEKTRNEAKKRKKSREDQASRQF